MSTPVGPDREGMEGSVTPNGSACLENGRSILTGSVSLEMVGSVDTLGSVTVDGPEREGVEDSITPDGPASLEIGGSIPSGGSASPETGTSVVAPGSVTMDGSGGSLFLVEESDAS